MSRCRMNTITCLLLAAVILSGCWDSQLLTNKKIINGISFDAAKGGQLLGSVRTIILESKGGGQFDVKDDFKQTTGASASIVASKIDNMLPGTVEISKTHVIILGDELAKKGILPPLEPIIRSPKGFLEAHLLISTGEAADVLGFKKIENNPVAFGIKQILDGAHRATLIKDQTLYSAWSNVYDPGVDIVLPLIRKISNNALAIDGIALMQGSRYSGMSLQGEEASLLLLMQGTLGKLAMLNIPEETDVVSFQVRRLKHKLDVTYNNRTGAVECTVKVELYGTVQSDPSALGSPIDKEAMTKKLSETISQQAVGVIRKMQQANCDALGIGRKLSIHYPAQWKKMNWEEKYQEVTIKPVFRVHIRSTGIIS